MTLKKIGMADPVESERAIVLKPSDYILIVLAIVVVYLVARRATQASRTATTDKLK